MRPSGLKATLTTARVPAQGGPSGLRVRTSHSHTVVVAPVGDQAPGRADGDARRAEGELTAPSVVGAQGSAELPVAGHVPEPHRPVVGGGGEHAPVRAERDALDLVRMAGERQAEDVRRPHVPEPHGAVEAGGGERAAVRAERDAVDLVHVASEGRAERLERPHVPEPDRPVRPGRGERAPVGAEGDAPDLARGAA